MTIGKIGPNLVLRRGEGGYIYAAPLGDSKERDVILVIDDEPTITELLTDILEYQGHPVVVANDAETALDILPLHRPSVILVDLMMPSVDGLSLAVTLRHSPAVAGVPLIAMSASDSALALADRIGDFNAYLSKPFENDELIELVERFLPVRS